MYDQDVASELLQDMMLKGIKRLPPSYHPLKITLDHPGRGEERRKLAESHRKRVLTKWKQSPGAWELKATREHFNKLVIALYSTLETTNTDGTRAYITRRGQKTNTSKRMETSEKGQHRPTISPQQRITRQSRHRAK